MTAQILDHEEYIEQAYFFRVYRERLLENWPAQEILTNVREEILSTTKLPIAISYLSSEMVRNGRISEGMERLPHYFTPFQIFIMAKAEVDDAKFDHLVALMILEREAEYRAGEHSPAGIFVYQFECLARNRLGYDFGMEAIAGDPVFDDDWREWIRRIRRQLGSCDFADLIYFRSEHFLAEKRRESGDDTLQPTNPVLFGVREGRIAKANQKKDPLFMFAALQRQLGYPSVPRPKARADGPIIHPALENRLHRLEQRLQLIESEQKGGIDLTKFYVNPADATSGDSGKP